MLKGMISEVEEFWREIEFMVYREDVEKYIDELELELKDREE